MTDEEGFWKRIGWFVVAVLAMGVLVWGLASIVGWLWPNLIWPR